MATHFCDAVAKQVVDENAAEAVRRENRLVGKRRRPTKTQDHLGDEIFCGPR